MKYEMLFSLRHVARSSLRMGRTFAPFGIVLSGAEGVVEKWRGEHDIYNGLIGAVAGGVVFSEGVGVGARTVSIMGMTTMLAVFHVVIHAMGMGH